MKDQAQIDAGGKINILLYHQVGDNPNSHTNLDCFCQTQEFYNQMEFLRESGYYVISLAKALNMIFNERTFDGKYIVLTFDDGCETFYKTTFPILEEFDFPSTIFPVAGYIGKLATWGTLRNPDLRILSKDMLVELSSLGVEVGAHTMDHTKLTHLKPKDALNQVKNSKESLEQLLGKNIHSFAYPHGDFNNEVIDIVKEAGFTNALTCLSNYAEEAKSAFEVPRKYITYFDGLDQFAQKFD